MQDPEDWGTKHTEGGDDGEGDPRGGGGGKGDGDFRSLLSSLPGITEEAPFELRALEVGSWPVQSNHAWLLLPEIGVSAACRRSS